MMTSDASDRLTDPKVDAPPVALVTQVASSNVNDLSEAVKSAFNDAMAMRGRLRGDAFEIQGFSGRKIRLFFNNLMKGLKDPRYLEIGIFHGASFCPAIFDNKLRAVGIDNWKEYNGQRDKFEDNLKSFRNKDADVDIIEGDFRKVDYASLGKFNVMFYDGPHARQDQYDGVFYPMKAMDQDFILVVDDWNWSGVREATFQAIHDASSRLAHSIEVRTSFNNQLPPVHGAKSEWHNGLFCGVISRP